MTNGKQFIFTLYLCCIQNLAISLAYLNQLILYYSDNRRLQIYHYVIIIISSIIQSFSHSRQMRGRQIGVGFFILFILFRSEWVACSKSIQELSIYQIFQMLFNAFPILVSNILIISDPNLNEINSYYFFMILISYFYFGTVLLFVITVRKIFRKQNVIFKSLPQLAITFSYWYILLQSFEFEKIIAITFLSLNLFMLLIELKYLLNRSAHANSQLFYSMLKYILQFNCMALNTFYQNSKDYYLADWIDLIFSVVQCLNTFILFTLKQIYYPSASDFDKVIYALLGVSCLQILIVFLNIYHKITKSNIFYKYLEWNESMNHFENFKVQTLSNKFFYEINIFIYLKTDIDKTKDLQKLTEHSTKVNKMIFEQCQNSRKSYQINLNHHLNCFQFSQIHNNSRQEQGQILKFQGENQDTIDSIQLFSQINILIDRKINLIIEVNKQLINYICKMLVQIQYYDDLNYQIISITQLEGGSIVQDQLDAQENLNSFLRQIKLYVLQACAFKKQISSLLTINPTMVLYDLICADQ